MVETSVRYSQDGDHGQPRMAVITVKPFWLHNTDKSTQVDDLFCEILREEV